MKITRYVCDRCGKEVSPLERTVVEIRDMASGQEVDLCPECTEVLDAWLDNGAEDVAHRIATEMVAERGTENKKDGD